MNALNRIKADTNSPNTSFALWHTQGKSNKSNKMQLACMIMQLLVYMKLIQRYASTLKHYFSHLRARKANFDFLSTFWIPFFPLWLVSYIDSSVWSTDWTLAEGCMPITSFMEEYLHRESEGFFLLSIAVEIWGYGKYLYNMLTCELH